MKRTHEQYTGPTPDYIPPEDKRDKEVRDASSARGVFFHGGKPHSFSVVDGLLPEGVEIQRHMGEEVDEILISAVPFLGGSAASVRETALLREFLDLEQTLLH